MLTQEQLKELLHYNPETGIFFWIKKRNNAININTLAGSKNNKGYFNIKIYGKSYKSHRLAWLYFYGEWPNGVIDHINCIKSDNRILNLRVLTSSENLQNMTKPRLTSNSKYLGVSYNKKSKKYVTSITVNKIRKHLGCFDTAEDAYSCYIRNKRLMHKYGTI